MQLLLLGGLDWWFPFTLSQKNGGSNPLLKGELSVGELELATAKEVLANSQAFMLGRAFPLTSLVNPLFTHGSDRDTREETRAGIVPSIPCTIPFTR